MDRLLTQQKPLKAVVREHRQEERRVAQEERSVDSDGILLIQHQQLEFDSCFATIYQSRLAVFNVHLSSNQSSPLEMLNESSSLAFLMPAAHALFMPSTNSSEKA